MNNKNYIVSEIIEIKDNINTKNNNSLINEITEIKPNDTIKYKKEKISNDIKNLNITTEQLHQNANINEEKIIFTNNNKYIIKDTLIITFRIASFIIALISLLIIPKIFANLIKLNLVDAILQITYIITLFFLAKILFIEAKSLRSVNNNYKLKQRLEYIIKYHSHDEDFIEDTSFILNKIHDNISFKSINQNNKEYNYNKWYKSINHNINNPKELIKLYTDEFIKDLDYKALDIIANKTIILSTLSVTTTNPIIETIIIIWLNLSQINDISKIYNQNYSLTSRLILYKYIIINALANIVIADLVTRIFSNFFVTELSQFVTNATISIKVGTLALNFSRIIPLLDAEKEFNTISVILNKRKKRKVKN